MPVRWNEVVKIFTDNAVITQRQRQLSASAPHAKKAHFSVDAGFSFVWVHNGWEGHVGRVSALPSVYVGFSYPWGEALMVPGPEDSKWDVSGYFDPPWRFGGTGYCPRVQFSVRECCNVVSYVTAADAAFSPARLVGKLETVEGMLCLKSRS